jgi:hypothetical protein
MRGYILKKGKKVKAVYAAQGGVGDVGLDQRWGFGPEVNRVLPNMEDGLHRARFSRYDEVLTVTPGREVKSAQKEADRLRNRANNQTRTARTDSPGVCFSSRNPSMGYQHMANMASSRLDYLQRESLALATWLEVNV